MKELFKGICEERVGKQKLLLTRNLAPGKTVYDEKLININNIEYREWKPERSKLAAAINKGIKHTGINENSIVLYLGAASGTTVSHISDIASNGIIFAVDSAPRVLRELIYVAEERKNIAPILADANSPESYFHLISKADFLYQDIAQKNQLEIFLKNINLYLKKGSIAMLAVKSRSIDVAKKPEKIYEEVKNMLKQHLEILDFKTLDPFQKDHGFFIVKK